MVQIEPKFKIGSTIRHKVHTNITAEIVDIKDGEYIVRKCNGTHLPIEWQDSYEIVDKDDMIRKEIQTYLHNELHNIAQPTPRTNEFERWISYLENQEKQKPTIVWDDKEKEMMSRFLSYFINHLKNPVGMWIMPENWEGMDVNAIIAWLKKVQKTMAGEYDCKPIEHNNDPTIDSALNDYVCKIYSALAKENGGKLSFARLQHLAMDIQKWCNERN